MKRTVSAMAAVGILLLGLPAQEPVSPGSGEPPMFAFRLLDNHVSSLAQSDRTAGTILVSVGGAFIAAGLGGALYTFIVPPDRFAFGAENLLEWQVASCVAGGAGVLLSVAGLPLLERHEDFYRAKYSLMYSEADPVVREAIAYGILRDLAAEAGRKRVYSGAIAASTPIVNFLVNGFVGSASGKPDAWSQSMSDIGFISWFNLVSGFATIFFTKSTEERLLDTYLSMSSAYAGDRK